MPAPALPGLRNSCALLTHASETPGIADTKKAAMQAAGGGGLGGGGGGGGGALVGTAGALRYGYGGGEDKWWTGGR